MRKPTISIIVPVYNAEKYLKHCITSILSQKYSDLEVLLINDGSTDKSGDICCKYAATDDRIRVFHKKNGGVSSARNTGLELASGEFVMFIDSDDQMSPELCSLMFHTMVSRKSDLVICGTKETGNGIWAPTHDKDYSIEELRRDGAYLIGTELLSPPWNKIYKKTLITEKFNESTSFGEDLLFNLSYLSNCSKITFIPDTPFFHTKDNCDSLSRKVYPQRLDEIELCRTALSKFFPMSEPAISQKYLHDLAIYSRLLFKTANCHIDDLYLRLDEWRKDTSLTFKMISDSKESLSNKLILFWMLNGKWRLAKVQINLSPILHDAIKRVHG